MNQWHVIIINKFNKSIINCVYNCTLFIIIATDFLFEPRFNIQNIEYIKKSSAKKKNIVILWNIFIPNQTGADYLHYS